MAAETASLLVVCTGNASRSVMAGIMFEHLASRHGLALSVATGGTHAVDGMPLGARTLAALRTVPDLVATSLDNGPVAAHRSRQLSDEGLRHADLVVAMETGHVRYVRRHHPGASSRTGMLGTLARDLAPGTPPLADRVARLDLEHVAPNPADDVADPAGHEAAAYASCAAELWALCNELIGKL